MKKALLRGLIIALALVIIAFIPGLGAYLLKFLMPPRVYIIIGLLILAGVMTLVHNQRGD